MRRAGFSFWKFAMIVQLVWLMPQAIGQDGISPDRSTTAGTLPSPETPGESAVRVWVREQGRLLVPVAVNGTTASPFLFDTGATVTVVNEKLARRMRFTVSRPAQVRTFAGKVSLSMAVVDTICVGRDCVAGIEVLIGDLGRLFNLDSGIDGILGEDFLSRFNYLLDRGGRRLVLEQNDNLTKVLSGTRVSFETRGGKIYVPDGILRLLLDSGNPYLVLYEDVAARVGLPTANPGGGNALVSSIGRREIRLTRLAALKIGGTLLRNIDVCLSKRGQDRFEDGFLPLHFFDSVYVNNAENFLIVTPGFVDNQPQRRPARPQETVSLFSSHMTNIDPSRRSSCSGVCHFWCH